jgi:hypothetical protein
MKSTNIGALSFSARDLLVRLVRTNASIRSNPASPAERLWFHDGRCLEVAVQIADKCELLQAGLIEYQSDPCRSKEGLYRPSAEGRRTAGWQAVADAAKSGASY